MITSFIGYRSGRKGAAGTLLVLAVISLSCGAPPNPQKLTIAAAADLNFAMQDIATRFRAAHPAVQLDVAYGSSGNFFAQIGNRAPFDIFLSADVEYPRKLAAAGIRGRESGLHLRGGPHRRLGARRFVRSTRRRRCAIRP